MHGIVLTVNGLNTVRNAMIKTQPKRPPAVPRPKNQASATATPDTHSIMDTAPPSVYTPVGIANFISYFSLAKSDSSFRPVVFGHARFRFEYASIFIHQC